MASSVTYWESETTRAIALACTSGRLDDFSVSTDLRVSNVTVVMVRMFR